jgi:hypothetical protein
MSKSHWTSLGSDWGPNLEDRSARAGEPPSRKTHLDDDLDRFLFRFALLAAIFLLALLIEYLAH